MTIQYLHRNNHPKCILFFNGWGMDENIIKHLVVSDNYDVIEIHDYHQFEMPEIKLKQYNEIYVIAWSMGIWAAEHLLPLWNIQATKSIAINGTGLPCDDQFGIPVKVFVHTLNTWNEANRKKFMLRTMGGKTNYEDWISACPERESKNQQDELASIYHQLDEKKQASFHWDLALIGENDLIFNPLNQYAYWKDKCSVKRINTTHFAFDIFKNFEEIINSDYADYQ